MSSSPKNDALVYLSSAEVEAYLDAAQRLGTREIEFTGGEPFMNREIIPMLESALARRFEVLVLTNVMRPMGRFEAALEGLASAYGEKLTLRVSLDHYSKALHEAERGPGSWDKVIDGLKWLSGGGFRIAVAGRTVPGESEVEALAGYTRALQEHRYQPAAPLEALITRWLRSSSEGIEGEQAIIVAQQEQRHTCGQHRPSCEKEQIFERLKILPPGREGGHAVHQENRAVADRFESADRERHHEDCLDHTDDRESRAP